jgi:protein-S-isoprenylcysteine O-methyltransferase Ste14
VGLLQTAGLALAVPYFVGALLYAFIPSSICPLQIPLPDLFRLLMTCLATLGIAFAVWGLLVLGRNWAPSMTGVRKDTELVTTGPYAIVRNPIYSGALVFLPSLALVAANWLMLLPGLLLCAILYKYVGEEEATLVAHFGDAYREYMTRTPRLVPKLRRARTPATRRGQLS